MEADNKKNKSYGVFFGELSFEKLEDFLGEADYLDEYLEAYAPPAQEKSL